MNFEKYNIDRHIDPMTYHNIVMKDFKYRGFLISFGPNKSINIYYLYLKYIFPTIHFGFEYLEAAHIIDCYNIITHELVLYKNTNGFR
jgi:hypothetical protein